jgi:hypothetical protein
MAKNTKAERTFLTLKDAVAAAKSGDTIEIRGDGPFATGPIDLGKKALAIRAGSGFKPHLKFQPTDPKSKESLLTTEAPLVLEGLTLERGANPNAEGYAERAFVLHTHAPLHVAYCRLLGTKVATAAGMENSPGGILRNCEILGDTHTSISFIPGPSSTLSVENNLIVAKYHGVWFWEGGADLPNSVMIVRHNTMYCGHSLNFGVGRSLDFVKGVDPKAPGLRLDALGNIFGGYRSFHFDPMHQSLPLEKAVPLLPKLLSFQDEHNLYAPPGKAFLTANREGAPKELNTIDTLAEWHKFWGIAKSTSQVGTAVYEGGDIYDRWLKDPAQLTPADFRLAKGSPGKGVLPGGKGVLPGGKDLGADVDKVGPGKPYEDWKKKPDYQQWRKKADALLGNAAAGGPRRHRDDHAATSASAGTNAGPAQVYATWKWWRGHRFW